jgi:hypothetical protein
MSARESWPLQGREDAKDGTPHPNPLLASFGWQVQGGRYVRGEESS